jgi:20S proteasome subunit beta 7
MLTYTRQQSEPITHTLSPIVSGGAIIGLKCKEGVILATDTLLSYGSLLSMTIDILEYQDISRY